MQAQSVDIGPSFEDTADFTNADRGYMKSLKPCIIKNALGRVIWNGDEFNFVNEQSCPTTVDPKLWRQAQLLSKQGLYCISPSIYQVRGFDISHITFVEGTSGVIAIDPLISCECATAAMLLYQSHRGARPLKAIVYTHSHIDHFGGAAGLLPVGGGSAAVEEIPILAPEHFMEEATSENVFAGPIMRFRSQYMYGTKLPRSPTGQIGVGLGMGSSRGTTSLIPPTMDIKYTGQTVTIDGVRMNFQMVPNTEAPAELNIYFPDERALLVAECATHSLHNIVTLRGALVRDAKAWSRYLDETLMLYCEEEKAEVEFGSHGWPTWGNDRIRHFLEEQRDLYAYIHDQTLRQMNQGWNGTEIAERLVMPPRLKKLWHTQGFYGSISHNVKGIYQRYMTWFDGGAENLWKWPPKEEGIRYVRCMGGVENIITSAQQFMDEGDLRFAATLLSHATTAGKDVESNSQVRRKCEQMLATVFERLGYGAENATWRNFYLSQALDLRQGNAPRTKGAPRSPAFTPTLAVEQWWEALSICIDGEKAARDEQMFKTNVLVKNVNELWGLILSNGALSYRRLGLAATKSVDGHTPLVTVNRKDLCKILSNEVAIEVAVLSGDTTVLGKILAFACIGVKSSNL